ncbi:alpha/beta fold hydrolase [Desulfosporosinus sp. PR]|uniref:alpha/beta hydrolase n=1 Tax=Candidatus Desulfosporosinus nitrosoreducens TaxID=3401928 RepID=UPI0027E64632|nr:alpha/beta fold hydrolase [Desulfosporosinus sp. PR]MDQ7094648.1 alpha/beta fold hydrolase [Desulfosporosinus sp. PR]
MNSIGDKKIKCLIIHGFGGGPHEVKPLADYLAGLAYDVVCPVLKGHSATRKEMSKATYQDWIDSAERELLKIKENGDEIFLIGFSMGGLIAFNLACKHKVKLLVTINTPIFIWNIRRVILNLAADLKNRNYKNFSRYLQAGNISPLAAMIQFLLLLRQTKPKLEKVNCPILITQAEDDDTVRIRSVSYLEKHLSSDRKAIRLFPEGGHLILLSPMAEQVMLCVGDYLRDQLATPL